MAEDEVTSRGPGWRISVPMGGEGLSLDRIGLAVWCVAQ